MTLARQAYRPPFRLCLRPAPSRAAAGAAGAALALIFFAVLFPLPQAAAAEPAATSAWWVFFTDRGPVPADASALAAAAARLRPEAWAARAVAPSGAIPDEKDLPLWEPYVREAAAAGCLRHRSRWLNAISLELAPEALARVRSLPFVREVRPVARAERQSVGPLVAPGGRPLGRTLAAFRGGDPQPPGPYPYGPSYGQLMEIQVPPVHAAGYTGNRVRLMMLDTGFMKTHNAFAQAHLLAEWDFVFEDGDTQNEPEDDGGQHYHGTGTWGTAAGYDPGHIVGPGYGATVALAKTEDIRSETQAEEDNYVAALEWAETLGVRVTSASLSYTCFDDGFCYDFPFKDGDTPVISRAVDIAAARGILCVNSAGNNGWEGPGSIGTPADADSMLAIGAVDSLNVLASFSSRGPSDDGRTKPEVVARGDVTWWADASAPDAYGYASGTSLSCPLVGGAATLIAEAHPEWSNMQIRDALMATADRHTHPDNDYGWGRINVQAAIATAPVVYPVPFDLVAPADGALLTNLQPRYTWRATNDPDEGGTLSYAVLLWESQIGGLSWRLEAGGDTTLVQPFPLSPGRSYTWEVVAEDQDGYRRLSREARGFTTPSGSAAPEPVRAAAGLRLSAGPNPFTAEVRARLEGAPAGPIRWAVYDPIGRRVAAGQLAGADGAGGKAGSGSTAGFTWDGRDGQGEPAPAGVYFLEASAGYAHARTMVVKLAR